MVEIAIDEKERQVREVDVLRSEEMIERHTGKTGSICFVVRRPGEHEHVVLGGAPFLFNISHLSFTSLG
jgi:hypothetical protein